MDALYVDPKKMFGVIDVRAGFGHKCVHRHIKTYTAIL